MNPPASSQSYSALTRTCYVVAFIFSVIVYVAIFKYVWKFVSYPIELEWREGSFWLHALAQSYGINIFQDEKLAYINAGHGIFDHLIKSVFIVLFRFLEPQYILRSFVLLFPAIALPAIFVQIRRNFPVSVAALSSLCLCSAMLIGIHDIGHWNTCVGRSDSTALALLAIAYLCYPPQPSTAWTRLLRHISYLAIALILSTSWRIYPTALVIPIVMEQRRGALQIRELVYIYLLIGGYTLATCTLFVAVWFHADVAVYYRYFFGFFGAQSPMPASPAPFQMMIHYARTPVLIVLPLLSAAPLLIEMWRHFFKRSGNWSMTLAAFAVFLSMLASVLALKMNFMAGGYWYLSPQVFILIVYYNARYKIGPSLACIILVLSLGILWQSDNLPLMRWYYRQLNETSQAANRYAQQMVWLDSAYNICSEEAFLFKRSRTISPVDMGDFAEIFSKSNYHGPRFKAVFSAQRARVMAHEPVLVFVGPCASSAFKELAENEEYCLLLKSPTLAIGGNVYVRVDHLEEVQHFLATHVPDAP